MNTASLTKLTDREYFAVSATLLARRMKAEKARAHAAILAKQAGEKVGPLYHASVMLTEYADILTAGELA